MTVASGESVRTNRLGVVRIVAGCGTAWRGGKKNKRTEKDRTQFKRNTNRRSKNENIQRPRRREGVDEKKVRQKSLPPATAEKGEGLAVVVVDREKDRKKLSSHGARISDETLSGKQAGRREGRKIG